MSRVGPMTFVDLVDERAGDLLDLVALELRAGRVDPALRAAERHAGDRGLPGHQGGEGADLVEIDIWVVADAALVGAAAAVVLDAVAGVDVDPSVGPAHRDLHLHLAVGGDHDGADVVVESEPVRRGVEPVADDVVVGDLRASYGRRGCHLGFMVSRLQAI
jgi:hypothetical protein